MWFLVFLVLMPFRMQGSEVPNFEKISETKNAVFLLSTRKSGANLISASLSAITRKPISWLSWKRDVLNPLSECRKHPSYNRLNLPLASDFPLLYRTHDAFSILRKISSQSNRLVFVTRNPKELLFRCFLLQSPPEKDPAPQFIENFLDSYLRAFRVYEKWAPENRLLIFYEDFIEQEDQVLLKVLEFMEEIPTYWDDFVLHKEEYFCRLLESYTLQHRGNRGGSSSRKGTAPIYYTKAANPEILAYIDLSLKRKAPLIWEKYLKRFQ